MRTFRVFLCILVFASLNTGIYLCVRVVESPGADSPPLLPGILFTVAGIGSSIALILSCKKHPEPGR
jgi:hypothetical protein